VGAAEPVDRTTRERAANMRRRGKSIREIARDLVPRSTIARTLRRTAITITSVS
jgi:IS30 family transposase